MAVEVSPLSNVQLRPSPVGVKENDFWLTHTCILLLPSVKDVTASWLEHRPPITPRSMVGIPDIVWNLLARCQKSTSFQSLSGRQALQPSGNLSASDLISDDLKQMPLNINPAMRAHSRVAEAGPSGPASPGRPGGPKGPLGPAGPSSPESVKTERRKNAHSSHTPAAGHKDIIVQTTCVCVCDACACCMILWLCGCMSECVSEWVGEWVSDWVIVCVLCDWIQAAIMFLCMRLHIVAARVIKACSFTHTHTHTHTYTQKNPHNIYTHTRAHAHMYTHTHILSLHTRTCCVCVRVASDTCVNLCVCWLCLCVMYVFVFVRVRMCTQILRRSSKLLFAHEWFMSNVKMRQVTHIN